MQTHDFSKKDCGELAVGGERWTLNVDCMADVGLV